MTVYGKKSDPGSAPEEERPFGALFILFIFVGIFSPCVFHGSEQNRKNFRYILKSEPPGATRKKSAPRVALFSVHFRGDFVARI